MLEHTFTRMRILKNYRAHRIATWDWGGNWNKVNIDDHDKNNKEKETGQKNPSYIYQRSLRLFESDMDLLRALSEWNRRLITNPDIAKINVSANPLLELDFGMDLN